MIGAYCPDGDTRSPVCRGIIYQCVTSYRNHVAYLGPAGLKRNQFSRKLCSVSTAIVGLHVRTVIDLPASQLFVHISQTFTRRSFCLMYLFKTVACYR